MAKKPTAAPITTIKTGSITIERFLVLLANDKGGMYRLEGILLRGLAHFTLWDLEKDEIFASAVIKYHSKIYYIEIDLPGKNKDYVNSLKSKFNYNNAGIEYFEDVKWLMLFWIKI